MEGINREQLVFAHCDLLSANVIILPREGAVTADETETVNFIDYEYATPSPAAFDIANHFAEWGGFDCDYNMMPTKSVRRQFLKEYVRSYSKHQGIPESSQAEIVKQLCDEVDRYRGLPGLYWCVKIYRIRIWVMLTSDTGEFGH
jgi:ethanolamine kinase